MARWLTAIGVIWVVGIAAWVVEERRAFSELWEAHVGEHPPVPLEALRDEDVAALIAVEDPGFWEHQGLDLWTPGAGMTTISQALVKRVFAWDGPGVWAKTRQTGRAVFIVHPALTKEEQLEAMLGCVWLGRRDGMPVVGMRAGAEVWFGKPLEVLNRQEFLALTAMWIAPADLDPLSHPMELARRVTRIEALLAGRCEPTGPRDVWLEGCAHAPTRAKGT